MMEIYNLFDLLKLIGLVIIIVPLSFLIATVSVFAPLALIEYLNDVLFYNHKTGGYSYSFINLKNNLIKKLK